ncbi:hypothetical protein SLEP1_g941 [Rubroshorea leprosula]|uniref:Ankyrin repeat protein n=1 Tax=Rubroshorea leprosula TaxID=152421 RepID=A0AAV5HGW1_9ROSI|nr:hypothetical protein SLEP1_g941 [Rubroshorea leprosula]
MITMTMLAPYSAASVSILWRKVKLEINLKDDLDRTPLHHAIIAPNFPIAVYLHENAANPNAVTIKRETALHFAAEKESKELLKPLLSKGADINAVTYRSTPLHLALAEGKMDFVEFLLHKNASLIATCTFLWCYLTAWKILRGKRKSKEQFWLSKSKAAEALNRKDYFGAVKLYTETLYCSPKDATILCNRSLCWLLLNEGGTCIRTS